MGKVECADILNVANIATQYTAERLRKKIQDIELEVIQLEMVENNLRALSIAATSCDSFPQYALETPVNELKAIVDRLNETISIAYRCIKEEQK